MTFQNLPAIPRDQTHDVENLLHALLAARAATANAGNRRSLYGKMDALLAEGASPERAKHVIQTVDDGGEAVRLTRMVLRNWKAFERAELKFPETGPGKTMIIVGGSNGFGKSSILEAFVFALFGRRALSDIGFLIDASGGRHTQRRSYRMHLERSLHRSESAREDGICSVLLDFETADGPISIERKWYFDDNRLLIEDDEELIVRTGIEREPLERPADGAPREWYQAEIERRIMPANLAPFFVFDGEQVERWAERQLSEQVKMAISCLLGLDELTALSADLKAYARDRERSLSAPGGASGAGELEQEIDVREAELLRAQDALSRIESGLDTDRGMRNEALAKMASAGTASHADLQERLEAEHRLSAEADRLRRELIGRIAELGPLLLVRAALFKQLEESLNFDAQKALSGGFDAEEVEILWQRFVDGDPPLTASAATELHDRFVASFSAPKNSDTNTKRHPYLDRTARLGVRAMLNQRGAAGRLRDALDALSGVTDQLALIKAADKRHLEQIHLRAAIQAELETITAKIEEGERQRGSLRRQIDALLADILPRRADLERQLAATRDAAPRLRLAETARSVATLIDMHMARTADDEHGRFAAAVTESYYALAHKKQIARVAIDAAGAISLHDADGRDVTDYSLSAGESQLFAMALIAAVGRLVGDRLPLLVDTPLGRLDTHHRHSVLQMLASRQSQTILLTQPEEVSAAHLTMLAPVLAGSIQIAHRIDSSSGIGVSSIETMETAHGPA